MNPQATPSTEPVPLCVENVSFSFPARGGRTPALDSLSFRVRGGEWASVIGPSGCGKTTLLRLLAGLLPPDSGAAWIGRAQARPGLASYMPQADTLLPWRSALQNALLAAEIDHRPASVARAEARALFDRLGLAPFESHLPSQLSGGMRRRVALVRTFLSHRGVLLLDEPLGSLDALTRASAQSWLLAALEGSGKTVLLVTHDVEEGVLLSERLLLLSRRPARVTSEIPIALPRPRARDAAAVVALRAEVLSTLAREGGDA